MTSKIKIKIKSKIDKAIRVIEQLSKRVKDDSGVKVGLPKGSNDYPDGTSIIMVGTVHEFGSPSRNIPQRSYLRSTVSGNKSEYKSFIKKLAKKIIKGDLTNKDAMNLLGLKVKSDVVDTITDLDTPKLKNRDGNPLVDSGHLRQSITYIVED